MTNDIEPASPTIRDRMTADMRAGMKGRDMTKVTVLRTLLAALDNASAVAMSNEHVSTVGRSSDVARRELSEDDVARILREEASQRLKAADDFERHAQGTHAERLRREVVLIQGYLPVA